jgi:hypothetical protein
MNIATATSARQATTPTDNRIDNESPSQRVIRLYRSKGGPLLGWLTDEARRQGHSQRELALELGVTSGYIGQLATGYRVPEAISQSFAESCARYLRVPTIVVKLLAGNIHLSDFASHENRDENMLELAFSRLLADPEVSRMLPPNADTLPEEAKRMLVLLYADVACSDLFGLRQLPDIVHSLQRAALIDAEHHVVAAS